MVNAYEKTVLSVVSIACPLSQNAAGLDPRKKKNGRRGKKNPMTMPLSTARPRESLSDDPPPAPVPPLPSASIHCSSSTRACSSSVFKVKIRGLMKCGLVCYQGWLGGRTFFFRREFRCGDVIRGRARMELSSKVQNVISGKTCRREAVKAAQRFDLRLLEYGCGGWTETNEK